MNLDTIIAAICRFAPPELAESWDKVGLHVGTSKDTIRRVLLCIDLTQTVVSEAVEHQADLIVSYHPPIFSPLETLAPVSWKHRALLMCVKHDIAVYSPHTALDAAPDGLNHWLAMGLGLASEIRPIRPRIEATQGKLVTFVPPDQADHLRDALHTAGAGRYGEYSRCSFRLSGEGTFQGNEHSHPALGRAGRFEQVREERLEMIFPWPLRQKMADTLRRAHPYEEPAFDIYPLESLVRPGEQAGQGRLVMFRRPVTLATLAGRIRKMLGISGVSVYRAAETGQSIRTLGLCAGAGGALLQDAGKVDAFFTGEMRYHDVLDANQQGMHLLLAGHRETEAPFLPVWCKRLSAVTGKEVVWHVSRA